MSDIMMHATAVAIQGNGVLLTGPSGSGKSDLALRLIDRGAILIGDDAVGIKAAESGPSVVAAPNIVGKIEVRGMGICHVGHAASAPLRLIVRLTNDIERMPAAELTRDLAGYSMPLMMLAPFESSAVLKLEYALRSVIDS